MEYESQLQEMATNDNRMEREDNKFVDLSGTSLTMVPATLFKRLDITRLDVSENNIKNLPIEISNLKNLQFLNISKNGFPCTSSDDTVVLPRGMKNLKSLHYLNISECNLQFVPATIWEITSLKQLDISRNNIRILQPNVGNLDNLVWLNAQHTGITALPQEIVGCQKLETFLLYGNIIKTIPYLLANMVFLQNLSINLRHMATNIDSNMESLLHSGQIISDHISNTIFNLPSVKRIELEYCKINHFKEFKSKVLEELFIRGNFFRNIPNPLLDLERLTTLDLSDNLLVNVSGDVLKLVNVKTMLLKGNLLENVSSDLFRMKSLEILDLSYNKLEEITVPSNFRNQSLINFIINNNQIKKIPDGIINLEKLQTFDISSNKIREIPVDLCLMKCMKTIHQYKGLYRVGLWLFKNPIEFPPNNVWNTTNIEELYRFLQRIKIERLQKRTPVRIILLGDDYENRQIFLTKLLNLDILSNCQYIAVHRWMSMNSVPFVLLNIDSHPIYSLSLPHFIDDNSLVLLFIKGNVEDQLNLVQTWINVLRGYSSNCIIQLVILDEEFNNDTSNSVEVGSQIKQIAENKNKNNENLLGLLKERLRDENLRLLPEVLEISSSNGFQQLKDKLEFIAIDSNMFSEDSNFRRLEKEIDSIEKVLKSHPCIYLKKSDLLSSINKELEITNEDIQSCLRMLHQQGKILWFHKHHLLSERVYPFISIFRKSVCSLLRFDYEDMFNYINNPMLKAEGLMDENTFEEVRTNFTQYGEISYPLYKILTFELAKSFDVKDFLLDAELGWIAPISPCLEENIFQRPYLVLPQFNHENFDKDFFLQNVILKNVPVNIAWAISIRNSFVSSCADLFLNLRCAINSWAIRRFDWENVVYLYHNDGDIMLVKEDSDLLQFTITIIVRYWSQTNADGLPCDGNFRIWIENWYRTKSEQRNHFSYNIADIKVESLEDYICRLFDCVNY